MRIMVDGGRAMALYKNLINPKIKTVESQDLYRTVIARDPEIS